MDRMQPQTNVDFAEKPEPYKDALNFEHVYRHIRSAPLLTLDNALSFLFQSNGSVTVPQFIQHFALADNFPLEQWHQQLPEKQRDGLLLVRDSGSEIAELNAFPMLRICQYYNGAKDGCKIAKCERLHVCLWWLSDPDGLVHGGPCGLCHGFRNVYNKKLLDQIGIGGLPESALVQLLRCSHPNVCPAYNSQGGCQLGPRCPNVHICNNALHRDNKRGKQLCPCHRAHALDAAADGNAGKLALYGMDRENLNYLVKSYLIPAPLPNTLPAMIAAANAEHAAHAGDVSLPKALPELTVMQVGLRTVYAALIRRNGQAKPGELLGDLELGEHFPLEQWRDRVDELMKPDQCMIDIYKSADGSQMLSVNVFRRFRLCPAHNGAPHSCQKADCCQLHLCLWYLADPDGSVHNKSDCRLCHDLTGRNHRIRSALGIADGLKQSEILQLLRSCHPNVCREYNSDSGCSRSDCPNIHVCNNIMFRHSGRCNCHRQHVLNMDPENKTKLFPFDMDSENPGHVLRSYLIPAPLPNTNPNPGVSAKPQQHHHPASAGMPPPMRPAVPVGQGPPFRFPPPILQQQPPYLKTQPPRPNLMLPKDQKQQPQQQGQRRQEQEKLSRRQKKLAGGASVPNIAQLNLVTKTEQPQKDKLPAPKAAPKATAAATAGATASAPAAVPAAPDDCLCEEFLRHECYAQQCPRLHSRHKLPFLWQWRTPGHQWTDTEPELNRQLEEAFCHPDRSELVTVGQPGSALGAAFPGQLTASFVTMEIRSPSGASGGLRCLRTPSSATQAQPLATQWRWFFLNQGVWSTVDMLENGMGRQLEMALARGVDALQIGQFDCSIRNMLLTASACSQMPLRRRPSSRLAPVSGPPFPFPMMPPPPVMFGFPQHPGPRFHPSQGPHG